MFAEGNVVLIANPAAQIGRGAMAAQKALEMLRSRLGEDRVQLVLTEKKSHASEIAAQVDDSCGTIVGLGGDGVMHEIANGLMTRDAASRPAFGVIPVGSGNDYAASLAMSTKLEEAVDELFRYPTLFADVGQCNGEHFLETLSFGLDAAIALGTEERRVKTGHTGTRLYLEEGIDQLLHHLDPHPFRMRMEDGCRVCYQGTKIVSESERVSEVEGDSLLLTTQIGPTYGGGFRITPSARLDDGVFDVCLARAPLGPLRATYIFLRAKDGHHTKYPMVEFYRCSNLEIEFVDPLPAQIDGERVEGTRFDIKMCSRALRVIRKG